MNIEKRLQTEREGDSVNNTDIKTNTKIPIPIQKKKKSFLSYFLHNYDLYLMLIPAMIFYVLFKYIPMYGVLIAFEKYNLFEGVFKSQWVGLSVFKDVMSQKTFWHILMNTLRLNLISLIVGFPAPIILALLLNEIVNEKFKKIVQSISYLPHFISWVIVYGMLVAFVSPDTGLFNIVLKHFGLNQVNFLLQKNTWLATYVLSGVWKDIGWGTILYISALTSIDTSLYEAASIDGCGRFKSMLHVTLPGIKSTIVILLIMGIGKIANIGFEQPYLMGNAMVSDISSVLSTYIYDNGLVKAQFSFTTAVGLFQSVVNFILLMSADFIARAMGEDGLFGGKK